MCGEGAVCNSFVAFVANWALVESPCLLCVPFFCLGRFIFVTFKVCSPLYLLLVLCS
jgi:hypothetical protein